MKISELIKTKKHSISFEVFPPKKESDYEKLSKAALDIAALKPSFVSVTYGAGGGTSAYTLSIAKEIREKTGTESIAHLTCISSAKEEISLRLKELSDAGIENIMALRGDIPESMQDCDRSLLDYRHATDLIGEIKSSGYDFCIGAACYPEAHPESRNQYEDIQSLKMKADMGVDFLTTQMVFDNDLFFKFMYKLRENGVTLPVFPGIMPITKASQLERARKLSGAFLPQRFINLADHYGSNPDAMEQAGIAYASDQIIDLFANGIQNVHVYTMNNVHVAEKILSNISCMID